jgi:hypothetical protein
MFNILKIVGLVLCGGIAGLAATIFCVDKIEKKGDK